MLACLNYEHGGIMLQLQCYSVSKPDVSKIFQTPKTSLNNITDKILCPYSAWLLNITFQNMVINLRL